MTRGHTTNIRSEIELKDCEAAEKAKLDMELDGVESSKGVGAGELGGAEGAAAAAAVAAAAATLAAGAPTSSLLPPAPSDTAPASPESKVALGKASPASEPRNLLTGTLEFLMSSKSKVEVARARWEASEKEAVDALIACEEEWRSLKASRKTRDRAVAGFLKKLEEMDAVRAQGIKDNMRKFVVYDSSKQANLQYDTQELYKHTEELDVGAAVEAFQRRHEKPADPSFNPPAPRKDINGNALYYTRSTLKLYERTNMAKIAAAREAKNARAAKSEARAERRRASDAADTVASILGEFCLRGEIDLFLWLDKRLGRCLELTYLDVTPLRIGQAKEEEEEEEEEESLAQKGRALRRLPHHLDRHLRWTRAVRQLVVVPLLESYGAEAAPSSAAL